MATLYAYVGAPSFIGAVEPRLEAAGFKRVEDVASASMVITYCTSQTALEDVYFGDGGLVTLMDAGSVLIDFSATTPNFAREINAVATVNDLVMIEAPVTVRSLTADPAFGVDNLMAPVALEGNVPDEAQALLECVFGEVRNVGAPGAAQLARINHTLPLAAHLMSAIEVEALYDVAGRGAGRPGKLDTSIFGGDLDPVVQAIREKRFSGAYTVEMLLAELSSALMAADDVELILPQAEAEMHLLELLAVIGGADMAPVALALVYREESEGAENGLDWTRAEQAYGGHSSEEEDWSAWDDVDDHDHNHDFDDFDFSNN